MTFIDIGHLSEEAQAAVAWAYSNGITNGTSPTTFSPDSEVTRGQMVVFLQRMAEAGDPTNPS